MLKLLSFSGCGEDRNGESVYEITKGIVLTPTTRHPRTFITTAGTGEPQCILVAWDTHPHGLMVWLQMGGHKERAINSSRAPPPGLSSDRESQQRDSTCVNEPQRWQEERQAQLCLARMPAAVVPDTRPRCHRLRRTEGHYACTPQEQQPLYDLFLRRLARPARPALNSRTHGSHRWLAVVLERTDTAERHHRATRPFAIFRDLPLKGG